MDALRNFSGSGTLDVAMEDKAATQPVYGRQPIGSEAKRAAVHEEIKRVTKLPPTSTYASHRLRVLNKILQLMAIQVLKLASIFFLHRFFMFNMYIFFVMHSDCSSRHDIVLYDSDFG